MENSEFKYSSNCKITRAERRALERKIGKAESNATIISANSAFNKIKAELLKLGWEYDNKYGNAVDFGDRFTITYSPIIMLENQIFNVKLIPYNNGIEISMFEVLDKFQGRGYGGKFLSTLLWYLTKLDIEEIYVLPLPVLYRNSNGNIGENQDKLESFFERRGFQKQESTQYWRLDSRTFKERISSGDVDLNLLKKWNPTKAENVQVFFRVFVEFEGDSQKNFNSSYNYSDSNEIRDIILKFHDCLPDCPPGMPDIKKILYKAVNLEVTNEYDWLSIKQYFEVLLLEYVNENEYKEILKGLSCVFVGFLFIHIRALENGINEFKLHFQNDGALRIYYNFPKRSLN